MRRGALLLGVVLVVLTGCAAPRDDDVVHVRAARLQLDPGATPPADDAPGWEAASLPDLWTPERRRRATHGWYRATVTLASAPSTLWAVYLPRVDMNAAVWVNGTFVGDGGRMDEPVSRNWNRPLLFAVPAGMLHAGDNAVDVRLACNPTGPGVMATFLVGPASVLRPAWEWRTFAQVTLAQIIGAATFLFGLIQLVAFRRRDPQRIQRWAALGIFLWCVSFADAFVRDNPLPSRLWEWLQAVATCAFVPCFAVALHHLLGRRRPVLEWLLFAVPIATVTLVALLAPLYLFRALLAGGVMALATAAYVVHLMSRASEVPDLPRNRFLVHASAVGLVLGAHDVVALATGHLVAGVLLTPYVPPLTILVAGGNLLAYFIRTRDEAARLNRELAQRVADKHRELERNYERLRELERERAVAGERERLMRDMHDGLGGQLVSTLALVESGRTTPEAIAEALHDALDDLRLVIDSLDPVEEDLVAVLGMIRARLEPRLARHGLRFDWRVSDLPALPAFGPGRVLQALRIVQEAITNVLKHARATTITVRTGEETRDGGQPGVFVEICDDGVGLAPEARAGRGIANMRRRASALGGGLDLRAASPGTIVRLWLPRTA